VWAPVAGLAAVVVLDEHDEALKEEQTVCWHARDVAVERARRAGVPCVLVSPAPTLEALDACGGQPLVPSRSSERSAWPLLEVVDRTREDPWGRPLVSEALARHLRSGARVVCVLNTPGKARVLACAACRTLTRCERCGASLAQGSEERLTCRRCGLSRPVVCAACGATRLRVVRPGTARLREELSQVAGQEVVEVTATEPPPGEPLPPARIHVGTEAVLHRVAEADVVAFCDLDAELLAPRFRAAEQAMSLLARAARLVGPRPGRILVQTGVPRHEVLDAALHADPGRLAAAERARREALALPPASALASVSGAGAEEYLGRWLDPMARPDGIELLGPSDGAWLVRAATHRRLCDALATLERPAARLRVDVDPLRL
jgi:primosomal protein N' (replication factor Y)